MKKVRIWALMLAVLLAVLLAVSPLCALADMPSEPMDVFYVNDFADVISAADEAAMIALGTALEDACGAQVVAVTVNFLDGLDAEEYGYQLFNKWKLGQAGKNNGVLALLATGDRQMWTTVGTGLESKLTASITGSYIDDYAIVPHFLDANENPKKNITNDDFSKAARANYEALCQKVASIYGVSLAGAQANTGNEGSTYNYGSSRTSSSEGIGIMGIIIGIIVLVVVAKIIGSIFRSAGNASGCLFGWMLGRGSSRHNRWHRPPPPPPFMGGGPRPRSRPPGGHSTGSFGGGFGGFGGGGRSGGGGSSRGGGGGGSFGGGGGGGRSGGGGGSRGGGAGRKF